MEPKPPAEALETIEQQNEPPRTIIVLIHWGTEYSLKSSPAQQSLAHQLIDAGADLIIGHHPHVVQDIEQYNDKLIFYSLGNFIFDQYFSNEVQQGLLVGLEFQDKQLVFDLLPIQSKLSQPFLMEGNIRETFLKRLAGRSSPSLSTDIELGRIYIDK